MAELRGQAAEQLGDFESLYEVLRGVSGSLEQMIEVSTGTSRPRRRREALAVDLANASTAYLGILAGVSVALLEVLTRIEQTLEAQDSYVPR